ncbi:ABC transporter ATP-binding protein [Agrobacterium tumefaciens]|uniref:ABC-type multidrug transport system fused ATPase/permease subunit n=1 Tax=Agrobacterium tumefaciens TaxID=358 RepID=A0AAW8M2H4_AGRTU|nr:ABC transporter ATP-binding protein [Agrobacterium tumefaciens]MBP2542708.1 ABC-type multidrug transport system fused ATPase/permease subunit [Agrobacterium tumefaciens]MBP2568750.1 ABC-type multidrug transport system fused ATPase/permease subunit [Agrobacterium tumefaciens]MBP2574085.1 ABC-type multidrug transport system fused ATPase/permease subunit [Agrobacterium tumefaciens]MDP9875666.1 ABC-type multidrug transport system fused ATPase/permease subunit [Agrobacterium tumefaciens]MDP99805
MEDEKSNVYSATHHVLKEFFRRSYGTIIIALIVITGSSLCTVLAPFVFSNTVDKLSSKAAVADALTGFATYALLIGVSLALGQMVKYLAALTAENLTRVSSKSFFGKLLKKDNAFFIQHNAAEIQAAQGQGTGAMNTIVQLGLMYLVPTTVQLSLTLLVLGSKLNLSVAIIVFVYGAFYIFLTYFSNKWARPHLQNATEAIQRNAKFVGNTVPALETLRFFGSAAWIGDRFNNTADEIYKNWKAFCMKRMCYCALYGVAIGVQFLITFWLLIPQYNSGAFTVGDIVLFNLLLLQLNQPFEMVGQTIDNFIRAFVQLVPFAKMWSAPEEQEIVSPSGFKTTNGTLHFDKVRYRYENGRGVDSLSFSAARGSITFLTGPTGSGKSTAFKLALRSIEPHSGVVKVDGTDLNQIPRQDWYATVGVVPQEVILLNETIATNIVLGREFDQARLAKAARRAAIYDRIISMPNGFETEVGERGLKLSGGERQRIAIARALYSSPAFLFLDEASSALDDATEEQIMQEIRTLASDITVIAITHRTAVITKKDQVIDLHGGEMRPQRFEEFNS